MATYTTYGVGVTAAFVAGFSVGGSLHAAFIFAGIAGSLMVLATVAAHFDRE